MAHMIRTSVINALFMPELILVFRHAKMLPATSHLTNPGFYETKLFPRLFITVRNIGRKNAIIIAEVWLKPQCFVLNNCLVIKIMARTLERQAKEIGIKCLAINTMNQLEMPAYSWFFEIARSSRAMTNRGYRAITNRGYRTMTGFIQQRQIMAKAAI